MPADDEVYDFSDDESLVPVVFGRNEDEAERYCEILEDHDIEAIIGFEGNEDRVDPDAMTVSRGTPVLVPESLLDEASEVISELQDELYEGFEEEDEEDQNEEDELELELDDEFIPIDAEEQEDDELYDEEDIEMLGEYGEDEDDEYAEEEDEDY